MSDDDSNILPFGPSQRAQYLSVEGKRWATAEAEGLLAGYACTRWRADDGTWRYRAGGREFASLDDLELFIDTMSESRR